MNDVHDLMYLLIFQDRMDLQDALKSCGWSVQTAMEKIRSDAKVINISSQKFGSFQPKRERLRDHEVTGIFSDLLTIIVQPILS